jgi:hypothetical protein
MAVKANLVIDQGIDFTTTVTLTNENNLPYDLTGYTVASQIRKNYASSTATATFSVVHDDTGGVVTLSLSNAITADIEPGRYLYDVEITSGSGTITRVVEGIVTVTAGITRV